MGPAGAGFLYCRRDLLEQLTPPMAGCISVVGWEDWREYDLTFLPHGGRFELGGRNLVGLVGLLAAVELLLEIGVEPIQRWTMHLTDGLITDQVYAEQFEHGFFGGFFFSTVLPSTITAASFIEVSFLPTPS